MKNSWSHLDFTLGIAIANLVNLFNPELVVLGGTVGKAGRILLEPLRQEVRRRAMTYPHSVVEIVTSGLGNHSEAVGAAALVLRHASELIFESTPEATTR